MVATTIREAVAICPWPRGLTHFQSEEYDKMGNGTPCYRLRCIAVVLSVLTVLVLFSGCQNDGVVPPEDVVTSFITDLRRGDRDQAMEALWPATRQEIEAAYDELEDALGQPPPMERDALLVVTRLESPMLISSTNVDGAVPDEPSHGQAVVVVLEFRDDRRAEMAVRWHQEQKRWFLDLPVEERRRLEVWSEAQGEEVSADVEDGQQDQDGEQPDSVSGEATDDE